MIVMAIEKVINLIVAFVELQFVLLILVVVIMELRVMFLMFVGVVVLLLEMQMKMIMIMLIMTLMVKMMHDFSILIVHAIKYLSFVIFLKQI